MTPSWTINRISVALAAALALWMSFSVPAYRLEGLMLDLAGRFMPPVSATDKVAVVAIDAVSLDAVGPWPWSHRQLAETITELQTFKPRYLGLRLPLTEAGTPTALDALRSELKTLDSKQRNSARQWLKRLDPDAQLARALDRADSVVLLAPLRRSGARATAQQAPVVLTTVEPEQSWSQRWLNKMMSPPTGADRPIEWPLSRFVNPGTPVGVGEVYTEEQRVFGVPLAVHRGERAIPGFEFALFTAGAKQARIRVTAGQGLRVGERKNLAAPDLRYYPRPAEPVPVYSLQRIKDDPALGRLLRDKTVLLGVTAAPSVPRLTATGGHQYPPVVWSAQVVDSLLSGNAFIMPPWFYTAERCLLILFALYLIALPAHWHRRRAPLLSGLIAAAVLNTGLIMLMVQQRWLPALGPVTFLLTLQLVLTINSKRHTLLATTWKQLVEARVALGRHLQSQGQLELAMAQFAPCLPEPAALESAYELGLEHERRRQTHKARAIYTQLADAARNYKDTAQRSRRLAELATRFPGHDTPAANATLVLDEPVMELPVLGRYRLERELGRGAMGTVYLATDPTIGRQVAIKTLPLQEYYDDREQQDVAQRFLKEAETVGRLNHANIVSIHDAGQEHDLAYMTMDYVAGKSLDNRVDKASLLPVWEVLDIAAQVADALDYAHGRQVVHRDIKPGNIIYDRDTGTVKITDFGIARMLDTKRTRTGTVLGTPSYMSPEQVAGQKINGPSDLYSLGTTLFQLLTGRLPFYADSVATLMYQIANQKTPSLRKFRGDLPVCVGRLVARAMQKAPAKRFASGADMAAAIRKCRAQFKANRRQTA